MANAFVRTTGEVVGGAGASVAMSFGALPAAGNFVLVEVWGWVGADDLDFAGQCSDNQGNAYQLAIQSTKFNSGRCAIFYAEDIDAPSGTFTVTVGSAGGDFYYGAVATEWSGVKLTASIGVTQGATGTSSTPTTGATAAADAGDLVAAVFTIPSNQGSITVEVLSPVWDERAEHLTFSDFEPGEANTRITTAGVAQTGNWTGTASAGWTACIATFKEAAVTRRWIVGSH